MAPKPQVDFLQETQRFWQERTGRALSDVDAREAVQNVSSFFSLLAQWERNSGLANPASPQVTEPRLGQEEAASISTVDMKHAAPGFAAG